MHEQFETTGMKIEKDFQNQGKGEPAGVKGSNSCVRDVEPTYGVRTKKIDLKEMKRHKGPRVVEDEPKADSKPVSIRTSKRTAV